MASCNACGTTLLFGGLRDGDLRFCNAYCQGNAAIMFVALDMPAKQVAELTAWTHAGACPQCRGPGPVDMRISYRVWSAFVLTSWSSHQLLACQACGAKAQWKDLAYCLVLGWWGFPFGLVVTPIQVVRNLRQLGWPQNPGIPSEALRLAMRVKLAAASIQAAQSPKPSPLPPPLPPSV
jgi:hypothetical protein